MPDAEGTDFANQVAKVIDGETLELGDGRRVHLAQVDAPIGDDCYADESREALEALTPVGTPVELELDPKLAPDDPTGRVNRYVLADGENVNVQLTADGGVAPYFPKGARGRYAAEIEAAAKDARQAERGLWSACPATRFAVTRPVRTAEETAAQENARETAEDYLATAPFSRSGLIKQLKFEGYSTRDSTYAVDAVSPNWNEQAAKAARQYLQAQSFSRSGLIQQLEYEGFTRAQATYGVNQTGLGGGGSSGGSGETVSQQNARESAEQYLATAAFSRSGLIKQLKFEGYSTSDATYAVNALHPNWNKQAAKAARQYLQTSSFSRSGLIQQLEFEGYTEGQATYGVNQVGL